MKTQTRIYGAFLALCASMLFLLSSTAYGRAGDELLNIAEIDYQVGGQTQTTVESSETGNSTPGAGEGSSTVVIEDQLINFLITTADTDEVPTSPNSPDNVDYLSFNLYNVGTANAATVQGDANSGTTTVSYFSNDTFTVSLATIDTLADGQQPFTDGTTGDADTFNPSSCKIYSDTALTTEITEYQLPAGSNTVVYVSCAIPLTNSSGTALVNNDVTVIGLQGTVSKDYQDNDISANTNDDANGMKTVEYVFLDDNKIDDSAVNNKISTDRSAFIILTTSLNVQKTVTVVSDPAGSSSPKAVPGSILEYSITVSNTQTVASGAPDATDVVINDDLPGDLTCDTSSSATLTVTGSATSAGNATCDSTASPEKASGTCSTIPSDSSCTLTFRVKIKND